MFSEFGTIFGVPLTKTVQRHAEQLDTRIPAKRDAAEDGRKKNKRGRRPSEFDLHDDMSLSAQALHLFLKNLLKAANQPVSKREIHSDFTKARMTPPKKPSGGGAAAQAASAYQSSAGMAGYSGSSYPGMSLEMPHGDRGQEYSFDLNADEVRRVYSMIKDLESLIDRGVELLHLEKGTTFLGSIEAAISEEIEAFPP